MRVLRRLSAGLKATVAIFVTPTKRGADESDRIAVMNQGCIEQLAGPRELYSRRASLFSLNFVGLLTRIAVTVVGAQDGKVRCRDACRPAPRRSCNFLPDDRRSVCGRRSNFARRDAGRQSGLG